MDTPLNYTFPRVTASYQPHPLPRYADNKLISALRFPDSVKSLRKQLTNLPSYDDDMKRLNPPKVPRESVVSRGHARPGVTRAPQRGCGVREGWGRGPSRVSTFELCPSRLR